MDKDTTNPFWI